MTHHITFDSAVACEHYADMLAADLQTELAKWSDSELRAMITWRMVQPHREHQFVGLTLVRELQRRMEVREMESNHAD